MAAIIVKGPPHSEQVVMSISNTRWSNSAQLRRLCAEEVGSSEGSSAGTVECSSGSTTLPSGIVAAARKIKTVLIDYLEPW